MNSGDFHFQYGEPPPGRVTAYGREFYLEGNSRWQFVYTTKHKREVFIFSKITFGLFDLSFFDTCTPDDLKMPEKSHAAISIYTAPESEKQRIPSAWLDFAKDFCTNPPSEVRAPWPDRKPPE